LEGKKDSVSPLVQSWEDISLSSLKLGPWSETKVIKTYTNVFNIQLPKLLTACLQARANNYLNNIMSTFLQRPRTYTQQNWRMWKRHSTSQTIQK